MTRTSLCLSLEPNASLLDEAIIADDTHNASPFSFLSGMLEKEEENNQNILFFSNSC